MKSKTILKNILKPFILVRIIKTHLQKVINIKKIFSKFSFIKDAYYYVNKGFLCLMHFNINRNEK